MLSLEKSQSKKAQVLPLNIGTLILGFTVLPYIFLAFFSVPSADDFGHSKKSLVMGVFGFVKSRYLDWSGRYSSDFLIGLYNVIGHPFSQYFLVNFYYIVPLSLIFICLFSHYLFIRILTRKNQFRYNIIYALIATISILSSTELRSTFFWLAGGVAYSLANSLFMISIAITIYLLYFQATNSLFFGINLLLIPLINGLSESIMVSQTGFIIAISFLDTFFLKRIEKNILVKKVAFSVVAIISALIVYLAPGNSKRYSATGINEGELCLSIIRGFTSILENIFIWINSVWICLIILIIFLSRNFLASQMQIIFQDKKIFTVIINSLLCSLYMSYFVRWYSMGGEGPLRTNSTSYNIFFLITVFSSLYISYIWEWYKILESQIPRKIFLAVITAFCCFSLTANAPLLKNDFVILQTHYQYYQTNYPLMINAQKDSEIKLSPEPRVKILRWKCYLTEDKDYSTNKNTANYFNLKSVVTIGGGGPDPDDPVNGNASCGGGRRFNPAI